MSRDTLFQSRIITKFYKFWWFIKQPKLEECLLLKNLKIVDKWIKCKKMRWHISKDKINISFKYVILGDDNWVKENEKHWQDACIQ